MIIDSTTGVVAEQKTNAATVTISPWVNEPLPDLQGILSSRDLARLTRRSRWMLCGLALIGRFPRKKRYRGGLAGWCRAEVLEWMTRELSVETESHERLNRPRRCSRRHPRQGCLPLECASPCLPARRSRTTCSLERHDRR
jgi:predicted DNA-binding transcriptional regulator AlpA